jgi:hypothetical protein
MVFVAWRGAFTESFDAAAISIYQPCCDLPNCFGLSVKGITSAIVWSQASQEAIVVGQCAHSLRREQFAACCSASPMRPRGGPPPPASVESPRGCEVEVDRSLSRWLTTVCEKLLPGSGEAL